MQLGAKEEEGAVRKGVRERVREGGREGKSMLLLEVGGNE